MTGVFGEKNRCHVLYDPRDLLEVKVAEEKVGEFELMVLFGVLDRGDFFAVRIEHAELHSPLGRWIQVSESALHGWLVRTDSSLGKVEAANDTNVETLDAAAGADSERNNALDVIAHGNQTDRVVVENPRKDA
jgi:hypothetical protein